jgi:arylsulfatase A-like enzyme
MNARRLVLFLAACACACRRPLPAAETFPGAPVILISVDTLRADHLPAYGYASVATPHISALQRDAIVFENAYSHCPLTLPSHSVVLTGLLPARHGVRNNVGYRLDGAAHPTLTRLLKTQGYATGGAVSAYVLRSATGIADSMDFFDDAVGVPGAAAAASSAQRSGADTTQRALEWLETVKTRPFFLFLHLYEPHSPYDPPEPFRSRYGRTYDGEIAASDASVGVLVDALRRTGVYDQAIIIFLSDHGEGLGDHGEQEHGILLYREALRVPLLVKLPQSRRGGTRVGRPVGLVDIVPTVAALLALTPGVRDGESLLETGGAPERRIYSETWYPRIHLGWSELRSLVDAHHHYIHGPKPEIYDVVDDPLERVNAMARRGAIAEQMRTELERHATELAAPEPVEPETAEKLKALGYLTGTERRAPAGPLPNPRDRIHVHEALEAAFRLTRDGNDRAAVTAFQAILKDDPRCFDAQWALAAALARLGKTEEATRAYTRAMELSPSLAGSVALDLARLHVRLGARARALAVLQHAQASIADHPSGAIEGLDFLRGDLLAQMKRYPEAERAFRDELRAFPQSSQAYASLAVVLALEGRSRDEVRELVAAMVGARPSVEVRQLAARTLAFVGDLEGARQWQSR